VHRRAVLTAVALMGAAVLAGGAALGWAGVGEPSGAGPGRASVADTAVPGSVPTTTSSTTTTTVPEPPARSVAAENALPGTPGWTVQHPSRAGQMEAYLGAVSAQRGDTVTLYASTPAPSWTATAYRMGWYGGILARQVWTSGPQPGHVQPAAVRTAVTRMIEADWRPSLTVTVGPDWTPGDYLFTLRSSTGWDTYVPLTVRDDSSSAAIVVINAVTTWQAYNSWGGYSLYKGPTGANTRADVVSFDRPYGWGDGSADFLGNEERLVKLVESRNLDVTYTTDVDLQARPDLLLHHKVLVSLGHDEYWSTAMRDAVERARDSGVNLVFLGANAVFRHIRFESSPLGPARREVNYRVAAADPMTRSDPAESTVQWRDPPVSRPESRLLGEMYECNPVDAPFVVADGTSWVFAGTGLRTGSVLPHLVGSEYDHWSPAEGGPPVQLLGRSPVVCRGRRSTADMTYYLAFSGAGVIDTGTNQWVPHLLDDPVIGTRVAQITLNILTAAATGPLGQVHPARLSAGIAQTPLARPPSGD